MTHKIDIAPHQLHTVPDPDKFAYHWTLKKNNGLTSITSTSNRLQK